MRRSTVLTAVLLGSWILAATAAAQEHSQSPLCGALEEQVDQCQSDSRSGNDARASCDRVEASYIALCGRLGTIGVSASAGGGALNLLRHDYKIVPIEQTAAAVFPSHLVIGPADLDDPHVAELLKRSYRVGKTVAIVGANKDQADRFHRLLRPGQVANCQPATGQATIPLYGLQRSRFRTPSQNSSYCLIDRLDPHSDRRWLRERFGPTPPQPAAGRLTAGKLSTTDSPTDVLTNLAAGWNCSWKVSQGLAGTAETNLNTFSMRDFTDAGCSSCKHPGADYYLVQDNVSYGGGESGLTYVIQTANTAAVREAVSGLPLTVGLLGLEFADPATATSYESSYTNGQSVTAEGSVGISSDGPNVTGGGSVTTDQSQSYDVPATKILNLSNLQIAEPAWEFTPQSLPAGADFSVNPTWTWYVPQDAYPTGGTGSGEIAFYAEALYFGATGPVGNPGPVCNVPYPFSAWTVNPPQLLSLGSASAKIGGGQFTITGQYLYPGSVVAVLIGGNAIPLSTNVDLIDDTTIDVVVPGGYRPGTYQVQVNTQFNGENRFSNTLSLTLTN
jgi:hypothetical protein